MAEAHSLVEAFELQAVACENLGSSLYARLLRGLAAELPPGGRLHALFARHGFEKPLHDAVALRLLGALHRIVLRGDAPDLGALYPSAGGVDDGCDPTPRALATIDAHGDEVDAALRRGVQTNEVGRCATLVVGFTAVARRSRLPLRLLEIGASAGLNLRWDRYSYDTGATCVGDPTSRLRFTGAWADPLPNLAGDVRVVERGGCDRAPLDAASPGDRATLLSFVWPDQLERFARLRDALELAETFPVEIVREDAAPWLARSLARPSPGAATIVFHSIVWQYLPTPTKVEVRRCLTEAGDRASPTAPMFWLRMEPAGPVADLRVTSWPGGAEEVLATSGYHGPPVRTAASVAVGEEP